MHTKLISLFVLLFFLNSCKNNFDEKEKKAILQNIHSLGDFYRIDEIQKMGTKIEGDVFNYQKFSIKITILKSCLTNLIENVCVPQLYFTEPNGNENINNKLFLILKNYKSSDTLTIIGIQVSIKNKEDLFLLSKNNYLFYKLGKNNEQKLTKTQICDALNTNFQNSRYFHKLKYISPKDLKLADRAGLIFVGSEAFRSTYTTDYSDGKKNIDDGINLLMGIGFIAYSCLENETLECE